MNIELPKTSQEHYLTGITALNIPDEIDVTTGDWHMSEAFNPGFGRVPVFNLSLDYVPTNDIFGTDSIRECSTILKRYGYEPNDTVYSANHYRAIADMVYDDLRHEQKFEGAIILDDWLPKDEHKQRFFTFFEIAKSHLSEGQWNRYLSWKNNC